MEGAGRACWATYYYYHLSGRATPFIEFWFEPTRGATSLVKSSLGEDLPLAQQAVLLP